ncbi:MAG TPA: hydrogenase maturation nickel metallochaperone HypA [Solirubrobacteraceae bacterium]|nr:hydrogenase maturation nickel metallochaperone HypA [Solirubrobacteraceae bacterium]
MHELALARGILDAALAHADGRRVRRVEVTVGALRQVVGDSLAFHFEILARGTPCEGAQLAQRPQPARLRCACGEEWELTEPSFRCGRCGGARVSVIAGEELRVEAIEVEEEPCTARR